MYKKICKNPKCGKEFESESRNTRYCCDFCYKQATNIRLGKEKVKKRRRKEYDRNKEINRALSKAYSLCEAVFDLYKIPKQCSCSRFSLNGECTEDLQRHHIDGNPFNNSPWNLCYLCSSHHKQFHDRRGNVNMVDTYNEAVEYSGSGDNVSGLMIDYTKSKIQRAIDEDTNMMGENSLES